MKKQIAIYCCNFLFGAGVQCLLKDMSDWTVTNCARPDAIIDLEPQLVIADLNSVKALSLELLYEQGAMLLLLETEKMEGTEQEKLLSLTSRGLVGILNPTTDIYGLQKAIRSVSAGELWMERKTIRTLLSGISSSRSEVADATLTEKEKEIVKMVCQGYRNKEIMHLLHVSEQSVKSHLHRIFRKIGVTDRLKLALHFTQHNPDQINNQCLAETKV